MLGVSVSGVASLAQAAFRRGCGEYSARELALAHRGAVLLVAHHDQDTSRAGVLGGRIFCR